VVSVVSETYPSWLHQPWASVVHRPGAASILCHPGLSPRAATNLAAKGLVPVALEGGGPEGLTWKPVGGGQQHCWRPDELVVHRAGSLAQAMRPWQQPGDPLAHEAVFVMAQNGPGPRALLERLLLLGREDATLAELGPELNAPSHIFIRLRDPPLYLLMRARDTPEEQTIVFVRPDDGPLWLEWGHQHPLASAVVAGLRAAGQSAWIDRYGAWQQLPPARDWAMRSLFDAVAPRLDASEQTLKPEPGTSRFEIRLQLAPGPPSEAELWLLSPEELYELEDFIEASTSDELGRLTVARLHNGEGVVYLLRERVRPGVARVATRLSQFLGVDGYTRVAGADNLYLPNARRLVPMIRRDDLRDLLHLDAHTLVILGEDRDGPKILSVNDLEESPLLSWVD